MTTLFKYSLSAPGQILRCSFLNSKTCALYVDNVSYSYEQLSHDILKLTSFFIEQQLSETSIGVYAARNYESYVAAIAIMLSSNRYVPLNPKFPVDKNSKICELSEIKYVFLGDQDSKPYCELHRELSTQPIVIRNSLKKGDVFDAEFLYWDEHKYNLDDTLLDLINNLAKPEQIAYILFTSGSTGLPKGVPITHKNLASYIHNVKSLTHLKTNDRCTQMFDLTFDLSIHDIFVTLSSGASLYVVPDKSVTAPAKFIKEHELTHWFSVPSVISFMKTFKMLKENAFPFLKMSLFCGEALSVDNVKIWQKACPNSKITNIYGPTEATIGITYFHWNDSLNELKFEKDIVPIGKAFTEQEAVVMDEKLNPTIENESGELYLSGEQLSPGYWKNNETTAKIFIFDPKTRKTWYKTGDIAKLTKHGLCYLGRSDSQVKICGYRVELGEIESTIKQLTKAEFVCAFSTPLKNENATGIEVFVSTNEFSIIELLSLCKKSLPSHMVPKKVYILQDFPFNDNGKIDRPALFKILEQKYVDSKDF
jgi:D-alanine--poly(phosphoribitol) ligase subunit 1